jgi:tRNA threonylcarbamoyladenosine biosynthesis protein TsaB
MEMVSALGVATGPGSFTSLRVGLAFAKGLALARHLPLVGVPTLDIIAAAQPASRHPLVALIQAGRGRIAFSWYKHTKDGWQSEGPARSGTADELADEIVSPTHVAGELSAEDRQRLARKRVNVLLASPALCVRRPAVLAELAWKRWQAGIIDEVASLAPTYLHVAGTPPA